MRRVAYLFVFMLVALPTALAAAASLVAAGIYWLCTGRNGEHLLLNPVANWLLDLPGKMLP